MRQYNRAIFFNKKSCLAYWRRGDLYNRFDKPILAIKDYNKAILIDSSFNGGYVFVGRADAKYKLGDLNQTLSDYNKALIIEPKKENFYYYRSTVKYELQDTVGAKSDLDSALKYWPDYFLARLNRATINVKLRDYKNAIDDFEHLKSIFVDSLDNEYHYAFRNRGIAKYYTDDKSGACKDWLIASKTDSLATIYLKKLCGQ